VTGLGELLQERSGDSGREWFEPHLLKVVDRFDFAQLIQDSAYTNRTGNQEVNIAILRAETQRT
jgi:hypothetical protein